jgi:diguanylate cyclase (GGDEF)-like protein/PAS domain S-box-containing protein
MKRLLPSAAVFGLITVLYLAGGLQAVERGLIDARFSLTTRAAESDLVLVTIDPRSLETLNVWPWPRGYHATVVENLLDAGARKVAFDIDFSSRSIADEDLELERALARAEPRVVLPVFQQWQKDPSGEYRLDESGPIPPFLRHVDLATINVRPETDGLVRRYGLEGEYSGGAVPSLAFALSGGSRPSEDDFYIDYGIAVDSIPRVSYLDLLTGVFDPEAIEGKVVLVGSTAVELGDQIAVPRYAALAGPVLQAVAYESIFQGRMLQEVSPWATLAAALALSVLVGPWISRASWRRGLVVVLAGSAVAFAISLATQQWTPRVLEVSPWVLTLAGVYAFAVVRRIDQQTLSLIAQGLRIRRTRRVMHHVVEHSFDAILTVLDDGTVETFNSAAERIFRCPAGSAVGRPVGELVAGDPPEGPGESADARREPYEALAVRQDGTSIPVEVAVTTMTVHEKPRRVLFVRDITERKAQQQQLEHQATHDALTDLPNRYLLARRVERALAHAREDGRPVALLLLDLDRFKEINDTLGHQTGDILLREIAERLKTALRPRDMIARLGGDEFAVLLPATDVETARTVARWLARSLDAPFDVRDLALRVEASAGISLFPDHGSDAATLIQRADVAMYVAKRSRSGIEVYDEDKDFTSVRQLLLTGELANAIERDELELHYQPKVSAATGKIVGVEGLVRWRHSRHGIIRPDEFIELAEHSGLIRPLATWVLQVGLLQCAEWRGQGLELDLSVNLSTQNLLEGDLPGVIGAMLATAGLPPETLTLEITESAIMTDPGRALDVVTELDRIGVRISIDDFGTGYSSLQYLKRLPAKEVKIDKSFVLEMDRDPGDTMIVRSTIELAHNLGLEVVAEGVETEEVWNALRDLGCDYGQGFLFSEPLSSEMLTVGLRFNERLPAPAPRYNVNV